MTTRPHLALTAVLLLATGCGRADLYALRNSGQDAALDSESPTPDAPPASPGCGRTSTMMFALVPNQSPDAAPGSGHTVGHGEGGHVTMQSGGQNRTFVMRIPDNYDKNKPYWLIFTFHPRGGDTWGIDNGGLNGYVMAYYGLQKLANNGAIFVAPDERGVGWANNNGEDLQFVDDMIRLIADNHCVDRTHIFAQGFGTGGSMAYALACARATVFRGVAIYEGGAQSGCDGGNDPIAYWQSAGLEDSVFPVQNAVPMRDRFSQNNGCTGPTTEPPRPPKAPPYLTSGGHVCTDFTGCMAGHPLRWCVHQSGFGNAVTDGTGDTYNPCATYPNSCSTTCPCTWVPDDVWQWMRSL